MKKGIEVVSGYATRQTGRQSDEKPDAPNPFRWLRGCVESLRGRFFEVSRDGPEKF